MQLLSIWSEQWKQTIHFTLFSLQLFHTKSQGTDWDDQTIKAYLCYLLFLANEISASIFT